MKTLYWSLLISMALTGATMFRMSLDYKWINVEKEELWKLSKTLEGKPRAERFNKWYIERAKFNTPRKTLNDVGEGLIALAVILALFQLCTGFPLKEGRSPKKRWSFIVIYLLALTAKVPFALWYYGSRQSRFEYPPWGDSIFIPIVSTLMSCCLWGVIGSVFFWTFLHKARLPANLYNHSAKRFEIKVIIAAMLIILAGFSLLGIPYAVQNGKLGSIIMSVTLSYLFLSLRAGLLKEEDRGIRQK